MSQKELSPQAHVPPSVNWANLGKAVEYYKSRGFRYVEVPWAVPKKIIDMTFNGIPRWACEEGTLVASAEQSLLSMIDQFKEGEPIVAVSPCFRYEPVLDDLHQTTFMKVELFSKGTNWEYLMTSAHKNFYGQGLDCDPQAQPDSEHYVTQTDLIANNIEVGSYGYREIQGHTWSYGTGWAEPRMSVVMNKLTTN